MGISFAEPPPYCATSIEALEIWQMLGCELRVEGLPVILAAHPECDPNLMLALLRIIDAAIRSAHEA
jgi:hypothetical protein